MRKRVSHQRFSRLFPWSVDKLLKTAQRLAGRVAMAGLGTLALGPPSASATSASQPTPQPRVSIQNRERRSSAAKLILAKSDLRTTVAAHRSHRSHSSHRSHYSGSSARAPAPKPTPKPKPPSPPPSSSINNLLSTPDISTLTELGYRKEDIQRIKVVLTKVDLEKKIISGKDDFGTLLEFRFLDASAFTRYSPIETTRTFGWLMQNSASDFPLKVGEEAAIDWAPNEQKKQRVLVRASVL